MTEESVVDTEFDYYKNTIDEFAGRIVYKMFQNGEHNLRDCENMWINEYADILYILFPNRRDNLRNLVARLQHFKHKGVVVRFNENGQIDDLGDTYIIQEY